MKKRVLIGAMFAAVVVIAGCHELWGGGWFAGLNGGKAHFGFNMYCVDDPDQVPGYPFVFWNGDFQFMDKSANVRFHGNFVWNIAWAEEDPILSCEDAAEEMGNYNVADFVDGPCWTQPGNVEGTFSVYLEDNGTPGSAGDFIRVSTNCTADGSWYVNEGTLGGGNITSGGH